MMRAFAAALALTAALPVGVAGEAAAAPTRYEYWQTRNDYTGKVDFYGYLKWKGKRFCYQEWAVLDVVGPRRTVRQRAIIAEPLPGRANVYTARSFNKQAPNTIVTLKPTGSGYTMRTRIPTEKITYRTQITTSTRAQFLKVNGNNPPSWTPCPRF